MQISSKIYQYEHAIVHSDWLIVPFQLEARWAVALLSPEEIEPLYLGDATWSTVEDAVMAGKFRIDEMEIALARDLLEDVIHS